METSNRKRMKIIVTGSAGNIGEILCPYLESVGHTVFGIDIKQSVAKNYVTADINNVADLMNIFNVIKPDIVIHMAAMVSRVTCESSPAITIQTNVAGTKNIIELCKMVDARLMFFSTSEIYGNTGGVLYESNMPEPNNIYGLSKYIGEQLVQYEMANGMDAIIVRPFMFYHENETIGDHRSVMIRFVHDLLCGKKIVVHRGSSRSWLHLDDGVKIIEQLCHVDGSCIVNVGHPNMIKTYDLAMFICLELGLDQLNYIDLKPLPERMTLNKCPSLNYMVELTNYYPVIDIDEGIRRVIETVKSKI